MGQGLSLILDAAVHVGKNYLTSLTKKYGLEKEENAAKTHFLSKVDKLESPRTRHCHPVKMEFCN